MIYTGYPPPTAIMRIVIRVPVLGVAERSRGWMGKRMLRICPAVPVLGVAEANTEVLAHCGFN